MEFLFRNCAFFNNNSLDESTILEDIRFPEPNQIPHQFDANRNCLRNYQDSNYQSQEKKNSNLSLKLKNSFIDCLEDQNFDTEQFIQIGIHKKGEKMICEDQDQVDTFHSTSGSSMSKNSSSRMKLSHPHKNQVSKIRNIQNVGGRNLNQIKNILNTKMLFQN